MKNESSKLILSNKHLLVLILIVAAILRLWGVWDIPFMHDELSALSRTHFDSFSELISKGVKPDGHPAGIQIFLYYWVKIFGFTEWLVKLPFLLMGLASVYLLFEIGRLWFSEKAGLLSAAAMGSTQMFVFYSQIARPYISGVFFVLGFVLIFSRILKSSAKGRTTDYLWLILFGALAAYNHHFSFLSVVIIGITGLFILKKPQLKPFIISGTIMVVLYLPHLNITLHQLSFGGLDWLSKPTLAFGWEYLSYVFNYSLILMGFVVLVFVISQFKKGFSKKQFIMLAWFLIPLIFGYAYSVLRSPVLQTSVLVFSTPFLFLLLFSRADGFSRNFVQRVLLVVTTIGITSLVFTREHYSLMKNQPFSEIPTTIKSEDPFGEFPLFFGGNPDYLDFYTSKIELENQIISPFQNSLSDEEFNAELKNSIGYGKIWVSKLEGEKLNMAFTHFPYIEKRVVGFTYELLLLSATSQQSRLLPQYELVDSFYQEGASEWFSAMEVDFSDSTLNRNSFFVISRTFKSDTIFSGVQVVEVKNGEESLGWRGNEISLDSGRHLTQQAFQLLDMLSGSGNLSNAILKSYFWNKSGNNLILENQTISIYPGNKKVYGLYEDF
jgi:hypothetical protein